MNGEKPDYDDRSDAVTRRYRALSNESVPVNLDRKILRAAANAARSRAASQWKLFLRPLTVLASLAVVVAVSVRFATIDNGPIGEQPDSTAARVPVQAGGIADSDRRPEDSRQCTDEQTLTRADWQRCISRLAADGRIDDAKREQQLLDSAFPE